MPSSCGQRRVPVGRWTSLAVALQVVGVGCAACSFAPLLARAGSAIPDETAYLPIPAHFEPGGAGLAAEAGSKNAASPLPVPRLKPQADRSDAVVALLRSAAASDAEPAVVAPTGRIPALKPTSAPPGRPINAPIAEEPPSPVGARAQSRAGDPIEALQRELRARDEVIADLLQRVEQLERRVVLGAAQLDQAVGGAGPVSLLQRSPASAAAPAAASPPDVQVAQAQETTPTQSPAPGQFEVDESLIDRALERTLVQEGVLLLPFGQAEIEPSFTYTRREVDVPTAVIVDGDTFVGEQEVKRNEFETGATLRVGLPLDAQIEVGVPYNYVDESVTTTIGGTPQDHDSEAGHGFGDVSVGLAKTLVREDGGWWPDVIARVTWDADTGKTSDNGVFLGGGFNELSGSLSAVKRQDPLAFVGIASYEKTFEHDDLEPGDEVGFSLGTVLAASPETSLSFFFNQAFADDTKIDGDTINGSDQVIGTFGMGAATILGRNVLFSITGEIGLTDDAPDYAIGASLPVRFDLPTF
jgi:hypothetical protein